MMTQLEGPTTSTTTLIASSHPGESWENPGRASIPGQFEGDEGDWENEEFFDDVQKDSPSPARPASFTSNYTATQTAPHRRRRPAHVNNGSLIRASLSPPPPRPAQAKEDRDAQPPLIAAEDGFSKALRWLTWPLVVWVGLWLLATTPPYISVQFSSAFPLCALPGISWSGMCQPVDTSPTSGQRIMWADYPALIDTQNKIFEKLLDGSVGGLALILSLEIKNAEMATEDLLALVRISDLKVKDTLARSLEDFVFDAKKTGQGLQKLISKFGEALGNIMAMNDHALDAIESARNNAPSPLARALSNVIPWGSKPLTTDEIITETFENAMNVLSKETQHLIVEAESNYRNLLNLDEKLASLHEFISREGLTSYYKMAGNLAALWTGPGGNLEKMGNSLRHLELLNDLESYRKQAITYAAAALMTFDSTLLTLHSINEDMEDMRERVAAPDLLGTSTPVEVHMKTVKMGLQRLREGRVRLEEETIQRILNAGCGNKPRGHKRKIICDIHACWWSC